mmetsp:Transcript_30535/g.79202  ORF Transcript_30535/g.79202 Transcript_30535/m.79202 type:complete len:208 (+) Transcript_30535:1687-2310(+)
MCLHNRRKETVSHGRLFSSLPCSFCESVRAREMIKRTRFWVVRRGRTWKQKQRKKMDASGRERCSLWCMAWVSNLLSILSSAMGVLVFKQRAWGALLLFVPDNPSTFCEASKHTMDFTLGLERSHTRCIFLLSFLFFCFLRERREHVMVCVRFIHKQSFFLSLFSSVSARWKHWSHASAQTFHLPFIKMTRDLFRTFQRCEKVILFY